MKIQYRIRYGDAEVKNDGEEEFTLSAFGGKCYRCGEVGHRANKCPNPKKKYKGKCNQCGKTGHRAQDCWENDSNANKRPAWFKKNQEKAMSTAGNTEQINEGNEYLLMAKNMDKMAFAQNSAILKDPNVFIGDTGASSDTTFSGIGLINVREAGTLDNTVNASGVEIKGKAVGDMPATVCDKRGQELNDVMIKDMVEMPQAGYNLFSITKRLNDGWKLGGNADAIWIEKGGKKITFDIKIKTPKGAIFAIYLKRKVNPEQEVAAVVPDKKKAITAAVAHSLTGHINEAQSRKIVKHLGFTISRGSMPKCEPCALAKAKQKSLPSRTKVIEKVETPKDVAKAVNERIHVDISTVKAPEHLTIKVRNPQWFMMVEERTGMKWSSFYPTKNGMIEPTCEKLQKWKQGNKGVKNIRLDNAGENKKLQKRSESADWKLGIEFEYTARDTPQQNSLVEVGFATIGNRGRAMMLAANVPEEFKYHLFREAFTCATMLDGLTIITLNGETKTRLEHWNGSLPRWANALRTWGEAGVVKTKTKTTPKMKPPGHTCMLVGYAVNHSDGVYRMWNPGTERVWVSRDVTWLKRMYFQKVVPETEVRVNFEDIDSEVRESEDQAETSPDNGPPEAHETETNNTDGAETLDQEISTPPQS